MCCDIFYAFVDTMTTKTHNKALAGSISPLQATPNAPLENPDAETPQEETVEVPSLEAERPPLCKHWARSKICLYHAKGKCRFDHPPDYEIPVIAQPRRKSRQTDLSHRHRSAGGRLQTRNDARVAILRAFLAGELARNGIKDLSSYRVLDVAGGKGELAFQLLNLNNVSSCHVIDPRPLSLGRFQKRLSRGFYHRSQGILQTDVVRPQSEPERPVDQLRCFFSSELWEEGDKNGEGETNNGDDNSKGGDKNKSNESIDKYQKQREKFFENCYKAKGWVWPPVGGMNEHASCGKNFEDRDDFPTKVSEATEVTTCDQTTEDVKHSPSKNLSQDATLASPSLGIDFDDASSVVKNADLVVGMHPDQAVDAIVDAALYQNISFFVVPCCTYSREFPHRKVCVPVSTDGEGSNGFAFQRTIKLVTTYEELVNYLQAKSPDIKRHILPFEGRNICLYRIVPPKSAEEGKGE